MANVKQSEMTSNEKYHVPVVRSTFRILEELSRAKSLNLKEITKFTQIPKSTVFRVMSTLLDMGYVVRDTDRSYRISVAVGKLLGEDINSDILRSLALPYMLELRNKYGETVNLATLHFDKVVYSEVVPSEFALRLQESRGASIPVHASALGKAILAFTPSKIVEKMVRGYRLESVTAKTITDTDFLIAELKRVRASGFAFDRGEGSPLATCVGAPILDAQGIAVAALSISGPTSRFNPKKDAPVIKSLLRVTTTLSRQLGVELAKRKA